MKPANIIVRGRDPVEAVTLVDFGFARGPWLDESIREDLVGTVRYLAPEAAGLLAAPVDERSDLYALGSCCSSASPPNRRFADQGSVTSASTSACRCPPFR